MENELIQEVEMIEAVKSIYITQGHIEFPEFAKLKTQAEKLAAQIKSIEVNDENIKISKKLLAAVNNRVKELEARRIHIKKLVLEPYQVFEEQVKEIVGIVKDADDVVRQQVKFLEEQERHEKEQKLKTLFDLRIKHYSFRDLFSFADFLNPKHLNKTTTIEAAEKEMIAFLEKITKDLKAIEVMSNAETILGYYTDVKDLGAAITLAQQQEDRKKQIEASKVLKHSAKNIAFLITLTAKNQKELKFIEMLLKENELEYQIDKIENGGK